MLVVSTFPYVSHHCFPVDSLFAIFCQCAELNPEPNDGQYSFYIQIDTLFLTRVFFFLSCVVLSEEGEGHGWVFSADEMGDEEAGMCVSFNLDS